MKKTVVLGASPNPQRYAYMAVNRLMEYGYEVVPVGIKSGEIANLSILTGGPRIDNVDTVTVYVGATNQPPLYNYIFSLEPKRIIFNPGAENPELEAQAKKRGIEVVNGCTLVMLSAGTY